MPTSDPGQINIIVNIMLQTNPKTVLDIGIGYGKWGCLAREYIEGYRNQRYLPTQWQLLVHGIEIFEKYRNPMWGCYNKIFLGDVSRIVKSSRWQPPEDKYDLTIMMDVLEHLPKEEGIETLKSIKSFSKRFVFSYANSDQTDVCENEHENHISKWEPEDFSELGAKLIAKSTNNCLGIMLI